jgi:hypothetical protein
MVDGTPLLDIKPYVPAFDHRDDVKVGWSTNRLGGLGQARADGRFRQRRGRAILEKREQREPLPVPPVVAVAAFSTRDHLKMLGAN